MSLAWGSVANSAVTLIASIHYRPRQFGCRPTLVAWRSIAGIGVYSTVGLICNEITPAAVSLFIGRFGGLASLGQFSKGASLVSMLNQALIDALLPVSLSHLAQRHRAREPLGEAFLQVLALFTGVVWPAFAGLAAVAYPTIHLLFGSQWGAAVAPSRLIVAAGMIAAVNSLHGMVYQATGSMRRHMLVQIAVTPAQLAVLYAAAHGDLVIAAAGVAASALIEFLPSQVMVNRICNIGMRDVARAVLPSLLLVVATLAGALPALAMLPPAPDDLLLPLAAAVTSGAIGFLVGLWLTSHPLGAEVVSFVRDARQRIATAGRSVAPKL
jgi:O-antigen/teichoic acid export membrane protein